MDTKAADDGVPRVPLSPGERAPEFRLPAVNADGVVSLADYRCTSAVLVALFRGLHCPFCRQQIAQLGVAVDRLREAGVEPLGIINTPADRAALYLRHRPTRMLLLSDPELTTHRAFGLPKIRMTLPDSGRGAVEAEGTQLVGHFLIDRDGIVRWTHIEGGEKAGRGATFPGPTELLAAAHALPA